MGYTCYHLIFTIINSIIVTVGWYEHMFSADTCNSEVNVDDTKSVTSPQGNSLVVNVWMLCTTLKYCFPTDSLESINSTQCCSV